MAVSYVSKRGACADVRPDADHLFIIFLTVGIGVGLIGARVGGIGLWVSGKIGLRVGGIVGFGVGGIVGFGEGKIVGLGVGGIVGFGVGRIGDAIGGSGAGEGARPLSSVF